MCTLILGRDVMGAGTLVLGANRDEDPGRPADGPLVLHHHPRVVGGRDRVAGGTWLAVRKDAVIAILNRRGAPALEPSAAPRAEHLPALAALPAPGPPLRSRGLLALEVATAGTAASSAATFTAHALDSVRAERYAPFSLVCASADAAWVLAWDGAVAVVRDIAPGWHVLTHTELDDPLEPRTRRLMEDLADFVPGDWDAACREIARRLAAHDAPRVCLHDGRMQTVSHAFVFLGTTGVRYRHGEGRPCERPAVDRTELL